MSVSLVTGCFDCDLAARKYRLVILCQLWQCRRGNYDVRLSVINMMTKIAKIR